jgi:hypothetical protein
MDSKVGKNLIDGVAKGLEMDWGYSRDQPMKNESGGGSD